ncbi:MAG: tetratricopeptide repeat protein [Rhodospirillaceae bacterium]|nr:tetratricopeptide repeat protein [Rhodospirillaceae bacterium]
MPADATKIFQDALAHYQAGRRAEAEAACGRVLTIAPRHFDALHLLGVLAYQARDVKRAAEVLAKALAIRQDNANACHTYGSALWAMGQPEAGLFHLDRAIALKPDFADAYNNRGNALRDMGGYQDALRSFEMAVALNPNLADAHWHLAICHLQMGNFAKGWEKYEWRWRLPDKPRRAFPRPQWQGEMLDGKTILLHDEQGFGDTIQFCRYAPLLAERGAKVILGVQKPLVSLLSSLAGVSHIAGWGDAIPAFDFHVPLLGLPRLFKTDAATIPAVPRYLTAPPDKRTAWTEVLGPKTKPRIGLAWSGSVLEVDLLKRSIPLATLAKIISPDFEYISLQKELKESDRAVLSSIPAIRHFGDELKDFSDTAALCELVDVVITIDTSIAHLAGALGRPVWVVLPYNADWRWLLERDDSPWYPSARLFRQSAPGDWDGLMNIVNGALQVNKAGGSFLPPAIAEVMPR